MGRWEVNQREQEVGDWLALDAATTEEEIKEIFRRLHALGPEGAWPRETILTPVLEMWALNAETREDGESHLHQRERAEKGESTVTEERR
jgi:hypothetical protein